MQSLLIVRLSALGDAVHVLPALAALRSAYPDAKIGWAVEDKAASLLKGHPQLDRLHVLRRKEWTQRLKGGGLLRVAGAARGLMSEIRRERYQVALDFQSNFRSGLVTYLSGAPRRIGQPRPFSKEGSRMFYTDVPEPVSKEVHKIDRNLRLLDPLGVRPEQAPRPRLGVEDNPSLTEALADRSRPRVVLHAGVSAFGALKAWREERFARLGEALAGDGCQVLFAWGGDKERAQAERLAARAPRTEVAPPTGSILQLAFLLRSCELFVGVDSGPLHLASAQGTPVLGLYGPKHPGTYGPYWPGSQVVRSGEDCSPCRHRRCPRPDVAIAKNGPDEIKLSPCMETLTVDMALRTARELLSQTSSP